MDVFSVNLNKASLYKAARAAGASVYQSKVIKELGQNIRIHAIVNPDDNSVTVVGINGIPLVESIELGSRRVD